MMHKVANSITIVSLCVLVLLFTMTTPTQAGPFGILAFFMSLYGVLLGLTSYMLYGGLRIIARGAVFFSPRKPIALLSFERSYYYSTVLAFGPVILMGLQSVGDITMYEFFLVCLLLAIGCLYVAKRT